MFSHRKSLQNGFALKMLFSEYPIYFVMLSFLCLLFMSVYSFRTIKTPVNLWYSEYFGNQLWLMTAACTEFLNTNTKVDVLVTKSNKDLRRKMKLIVTTAQILQYQVRVKLKWQKED